MMLTANTVGPASDGGAATGNLSALAGVDLNLLVPLQALLEERSVTRAAQRVGITQPAMSHALRRCRKLLQDELLVRVGSSFDPTPRGRRLVEPLATILGAIDDAVLGRAGFEPERTTRTFRISATTTTALVVLPPLLHRLQDHAPGVVLHSVASMTYGEKLIDLPSVDLALLADPVPSDLPRERLYTDRWVAVVAAGNAAVTDSITLPHLTRLPHVVFDTAPMRLHLLPYQVFDSLGIRYTVRLRVNDFLLIPLVLCGTELIAVVQERAARALATAGLVRMFPLPVEVPPLGIDMVWNPRRAHDPGARWLREQLLAVVAEDEGHAPAE